MSVVVVVVVFPNFSHFHLLLQNHWAEITKLGTKQLWVKETQELKFVQLKGHALFQGEIIMK